MKFKEELTTIIIPRVEVMVKKEISHLKFLKDNKDRIVNMSPVKKFFSGLLFYNFDAINEMIEGSQTMLSHLTFRLEEYKQYTNKI